MVRTLSALIGLSHGFCSSSAPPSPSSNITTGSVLVILLIVHLSQHADLLPGSRLSEASPMLLAATSWLNIDRGQ